MPCSPRSINAGKGIARGVPLIIQGEGKEEGTRDHGREGHLFLHQGLSYFERGAKRYGSN
jgi:hypothetical protein